MKAEQSNFIPADKWCLVRPNSNVYIHNIPEEDQIFKHSQGTISIAVKPQDSIVNHFVMTSKRAYNSEYMREHLTHYLNYFEKFYDPEKNLLSAYERMSLLMNFKTEEYTKELFISDIQNYILSGVISEKIKKMNLDNYNSEMHYKKSKYKVLDYTDEETISLMETSLFVKFVIPLISHFIFIHKPERNNPLISEIIGSIVPPHVFNKIYDISSYFIDNEGDSLPKAIKEDIVSYKASMTNGIITMVVPKLLFDGNILRFVYHAATKDIKYKSFIHEQNVYPIKE